MCINLECFVLMTDTKDDSDENKNWSPFYLCQKRCEKNLYLGKYLPITEIIKYRRTLTWPEMANKKNYYPTYPERTSFFSTKSLPQYATVITYDRTCTLINKTSAMTSQTYTRRVLARK